MTIGHKIKNSKLLLKSQDKLYVNILVKCSCSWGKHLNLGASNLLQEYDN
jgi:hypothetical protein